LKKYYDSVFNEPKFDLTKSADYIKRYFEIKKEYETLGYTDSSDQKLFFIMYLDNLFDAPIAEKINLFESSLKKFNPPEKNLPDVRKLLSVKFREQHEEDVAEYKRAKNQ
jgi:hypothetical protein